MKTQINKPDLINTLANAAQHFGSSDWSVYANTEGQTDTRHTSEDNTDWTEIVNLYGLQDMTDANGNYSDDDGFGATGAAEWIVEEHNLQSNEFELI
ncbi:MAG: hypothetical protein OIF55_19105 [Amphritea sp.]|nr:hypothetical protein [Amphritea sp.]